MQSEKNILPDILETTNQFLKFLNNLQDSLYIINTNINNVDNNYFTQSYDEEFYEKYKSLYDSDSLQNLSLCLEEFKNIVNGKLNNVCEHEWIEDYIDIDPDRSKKICYCSKCNVTKG
jgi:conjugal transfer/entry exclusion protein